MCGISSGCSVWSDTRAKIRRSDSVLSRWTRRRTDACRRFFFSFSYFLALFLSACPSFPLTFVVCLVRERARRGAYFCLGLALNVLASSLVTSRHFSLSLSISLPPRDTQHSTSVPYTAFAGARTFASPQNNKIFSSRSRNRSIPLFKSN